MLTLEQSAAAAGGARWCELALWRAMSGWATDATDSAAAVMWDVHASHAAWRAGQWWDRLPVLAVVERDALVAAPTPGWAALGSALVSLESTVARMVGAYRVAHPRLAAVYAGLGDSASAPADGPLRRTLAQAEVDAAGDWHRGTFALLGMLDGEAALAEAAAVGSVLERLAAGGPAGEAAQ